MCAASVSKGFARKEAIKRAVYYAACALARASLAHRIRRLSEVRNSLRMLMYHKVNDQVGNSLSVPPARFEQQMEYLHRRYTLIDLDTLLRHFETGRPLPPRAVLLTFDDGYLDVYENAVDVLKRYGVRPVMFIATNFMDGVTPFPHDRKFTAYRNPPLSWPRVRELTEVFEIASHGRSHRPLTRIPWAEARDEIVDSKRLIEDEIGRPVRAFSYPHGRAPDFNNDLRAAVIAAGYRACFTTIPRTSRPPNDRFSLCRYNVEPYGSFYFRGLLDGSCDLVGLAASPWAESWKRSVVAAMGGETDRW